MANHTLREAERYDLSGVKQTRIDGRRHRTRYGYGHEYHKIVIVTSNGEFELPYEFDFRSDAEEQAAKFSDFLFSDRDRFVFKDIRPETSDGVFLVILASVFIGMFSTVWLFLLFLPRKGLK